MKRWIVALLMTLVAVAVATEVVGRPPNAWAAPVFTLEPKCVSNTTGTMTLTFKGTDFTDDATVRIFDEDKPNRPPILAGTNKSGDFTVQATVPAKPPGYYYYRALEGPNELMQTISVPCGTITLDPNCGPVGGPPETYTINVTGVSFPPAGVESPNQANITFAGTPAGNGPIGFDGKFTATITPTRRGPGSYSVTATDQRDKHVAFARFNVPCPEGSTTTTATVTTATTAPPKLPPPPTSGPTGTCVLDPPVGPPGFVTQARCSGFPANSTATLRWSPGIGVVTVGTGSGSFSTPVLILPRDRVGPRNLIVEAPGVSVPVPFIVVPPSVAPSGGDAATRFLPQLVRRY
jgi:hypothetical protein